MEVNKILVGCSKEKLKELPDNSIDSIVTDPPYELGFMGKAWDNTGIAYDVELWKECLRVLKHGGHLLAFSGTRTYHRMAVAIEDAGFEVRDMIEWIYGSGFPKSLNIGKAVDKIQGNERQVTETKIKKAGDMTSGNFGKGGNYADIEVKISKGNSDWEGWGTAMKPAHEPICVARKPIEKGLTIAQNCLKWGTGGINIDVSRVGLSDQDDSRLGGKETFKTDKAAKNIYEGGYEGKDIASSPLGRFPANIIHDGSEEVINCFPISSTTGKRSKESQDKDKKEGDSQVGWHECRSQNEYSDNGSAARFFKSILYYPKASKAERNKGCEELEGKYIAQGNQAQAELKKGNTDFNESNKHNNVQLKQNHHPTVKPVALIAYLIKLVTPKGGITLDPFGGSGTHAVASIENNFNYIIIEKELEHIPIIEARIKAATPIEENNQILPQLSLFD